MKLGMIPGLMVILASSSFVGCASIVDIDYGGYHFCNKGDRPPVKHRDHVHPRIYGGSKYWPEILSCNKCEWRKWILGSLDFPMSIVMDTAMLPITFIVWLVAGK